MNSEDVIHGSGKLIPGTSFTAEEDETLRRLLKKVATDRYRWPTEETMREAHRVVSMWAPELVVIGRDFEKRSSKTVLLTKYKGGMEEFQGKWHLPGGYNLWDHPDIATTCNAVATRELGTEVEFVRVMDAYKWQTGEHPYGHPLSLYCECRLAGNLMSGGNLPVRYFPLKKLPENMVPPHKRFLEVLSLE